MASDVNFVVSGTILWHIVGNNAGLEKPISDERAFIVEFFVRAAMTALVFEKTLVTI